MIRFVISGRMGFNFESLDVRVLVLVFSRDAVLNMDGSHFGRGFGAIFDFDVLGFELDHGL